MPTIKQKLAFEDLVVNGGNMSEALRKAGYSDAMVKNSHKVSKSKGFKEILIQQGITDEKLAKRLNEGLDATKAIVMGKESNDSFVDVQPDFAIRHKYIETSLKLKGLMQDQSASNNFFQIIKEQKNKYGL